MRQRLALLLLLIAAATPAHALNVIASFSIIADMVQQTGGTRINLYTPVGPDADPHAYAATPNDARKFHDAQVIFLSGKGLEGDMPRMIAASGTRARVVVLNENEPGDDPHVWNDAAAAARMVDRITAVLAEADPNNAERYRRNGHAYAARLRTLDQHARAAFAAIPAEQRIVITGHDAFERFGTAYGIRFLAPVGFTSTADPSARDVAALIDQIKTTHARALFFENALDRRLLQRIAEATGITPGGTLYPEALSTADGPAPTYERLFAYNVERILQALKPPL